MTSFFTIHFNTIFYMATKHSTGIFFVIVISTIDSTMTSPRATVTQGQLMGSWMTTRGSRRIAAFRGIPYAAPPVGDLRFKSPEPPKPWSRVKLARENGAVCYQHNEFLGIYGEEDCLFLNVYTPNVSSGSYKFPVLFFIHGGAFKSGSGNSFMYGPKYLLDEDIVLVTINYRLGVFGFLSFDDTILPGNLGLKDQRAALRWVRENIASFGGDPEKVTIFGESAGAASVHYHLLYNSEEGLFRAGILHSGSALTAGCFQRPGDQKPLIEHILNKTDCGLGNSVTILECLRKVRPFRLTRITANFSPAFNSLKRKIELSPVIEPGCVEDALITDDPWNRTSSLPMIIGTNKYEGLFTIIDLLKDDRDELFKQFDSKYEDILPYNLVFDTAAKDPDSVANQLKAYYFNNSKIDRDHVLQLSNLMSDGIFNYGTTVAVKNNVNESYLYSFNYHGSKSLLDILNHKNTYGPTHLDELFLFFPLFSRRLGDNNEADDKLSTELIKIWTNFITQLKPTAKETGFEWKPSGADLEYLSINGPENFTMESHFYKERMDFWSGLPFRNIPLTILDTATCVE